MNKELTQGHPDFRNTVEMLHRPFCKPLKGIQLFTWTLAVSLACCSFQCSQTPGSGSIDGLDLGPRLEYDLTNLQQVQFDKKVAIDCTLRYFTLAPAELNSVRVYTATTAIDDVSIDIDIVV